MVAATSARLAACSIIVAPHQVQPVLFQCSTKAVQPVLHAGDEGFVLTAVHVVKQPHQALSMIAA
jgi:hypothetical protein